MTRFETISPIDGSICYEGTRPSEGEIESALDRGKKTQKEWEQTPLSKRIDLLTKAVDILVSQADEIGREITMQMGRPIKFSPSEISGGLQERARFMLEVAPTALAPIRPTTKAGFERSIERVPLGLIAIVAPWNYPFLTSVNAIIPALAAGNVIVLKHSDQTPVVADRYAAAFQQAGLPEGVFRHLHMDHEQIARLLADSRVDHLCFTGSVRAGHAVQSALSNRFVGTGLELGGKDPAYVRADADLEDAIVNLADGAFFNSGQSCCGIERIYVDREIYQDFVDGMTAEAEKLTLGNPLEETTTLGPMVRARDADAVRTQTEKAIVAGAKPLVEPKRFSMNEAGSPYLAPQVLVEVDHSMDIMTEETFGPVVGIMPVTSDDEAVKLMNDSQYGLTASIWSRDIARAQDLGRQVETGTLYVNRCDYLDPALAWTGIKNSGRGTTLSVVGYETLTRPKSYHARLLD